MSEANEDHKLQIGALEIAMEIQGRNHNLIERVDVRDQSIHIVPVNDITDDEKEIAESNVESWVDDYPFTVSEWWFDRQKRESQLVISPYWPLGGQLTEEQLDQYDEFVYDIEVTA